jgi:hypothetical protein
MKSFKIILSIVGFALTGITFGQRLSQSDGSVLFYTVAYNSINHRLEHRLDEFPEQRAHGDRYDVPLAARTYFGPMETDLAVESWMTTPFESNYYEVEPVIESWMTTPFESNYYEVEPVIEPWMTTPFESNYFEADPIIEPWMTVPFDLEDEIELEEWMTTSWI